MVQAIAASWLRWRRLADKVPGRAERVGVVRRLYDAAELGMQAPECTIKIPVVLSVKGLQDLLPRPRRAADERFHFLCDFILRHRRHTGRRVTQFERG